MRIWLLVALIIGVSIMPIMQPAFAQITVNSTTPCFMNYTAGPWLWRDCGVGDDYLKAFLLPFEWITGGWFTAIIVGIFMLMSYVKYHKIVYPMITAMFFLPVSYFLFPTQFLMWGFVFVAVGLGCLVIFIFKNQTTDYS